MACFSTAASAQAGPIYWTDVSGPAGSHVIWRANGDGSGMTTVVTGLHHPRGMTLDLQNDQMYWAEPGAGVMSIRRANLDGSGVESLVTT